MLLQLSIGTCSKSYTVWWLALLPLQLKGLAGARLELHKSLRTVQ